MDDSDLPALYQAADLAAGKAQSLLLKYHRINNSLLIGAALFATVSSEARWCTVVSGIFFFLLLLAFMFERHSRLQEKWYQCRALAESIKTATWRFTMCADPFKKSEKESLEDFQKLLDELLHENKALAGDFGTTGNQDEISSAMLALRKSTFDDKRNVYLEKRIDDQREWYAKKSEFNRKSASHWFVFLCFCYGIALLLVFIRIGWPEFSHYLPVDTLAVVASCAISWMQLKRFDELASAYGLTAHEIGIIKSRFESVQSADHLSRFVSDAENAFSREHTQWAARRDH